MKIKNVKARSSSLMLPCTLSYIQKSYTDRKKLDIFEGITSNTISQVPGDFTLWRVQTTALRLLSVQLWNWFNVSADNTVIQSTDMRPTVWAFVWDLFIVSLRAVGNSMSPAGRVKGRTESCYGGICRSIKGSSTVCCATVTWSSADLEWIS